MIHRREILATLRTVGLAGLLAVAGPAWGQPSANQVLTDAGLSASDIQQVLAGELVTADVKAVADNDLSVAMAFLVKTSPGALSKQIMAGNLVTSDAQVQAHGVLHGGGSLADLSGLQVTSAAAQTFLNATPGASVNLAASEIAAFNALRGAADPQAAVRAQLQSMLLARFRAYQKSGLAGIAPYARGGSAQTDGGDELRTASQAAQGLKKYLPAFQAVLLGYPQATIPGMQQNFYWLTYDIDGTPTYVLTQILGASDGNARVIAQRQYYVSTGYNVQQAVAGLLPVQEGTLVIYTTHTFTDQVAGFGGSAKRSIGRRLMATKLKAVFDKGRKRAAQ